MSNQIEPIARLVNQLSKLPGIGKKSAQRLAFYIVSRPEEQVRELAVSIFNAKREVHAQFGSGAPAAPTGPTKDARQKLDAVYEAFPRESIELTDDPS